MHPQLFLLAHLHLSLNLRLHHRNVLCVLLFYHLFLRLLLFLTP
ncbi:hypothetical protein NC652_034010 [Populus alba x Populus x berolinensis]|uniref:Uncharacterized protein n=1 Tax=Populus alba x Populus x berolinensis TaxID=444605 RepID=A0AAD6LUT4_9ROSI|nr:hypothetical protein NC652_034010 [Populus alba x Populus x berolinensis]KAJ6973725.1 hypothetical protein NC653_033916 [Populus alba x Populus x berolinensis]